MAAPLNVQFSEGRSDRILTEKEVSSIQRIGEVTSALGTLEKGIFSLADLKDGVADTLSDIKQGILSIGFTEVDDTINNLHSKYSTIQKDTNSLKLTPNLGEVERAVVDLTLEKVGTSLGITTDWGGALKAAVGNSKLSSINSLASSCPIIGSVISKAQNIGMGLISAINRKAIAAVEKAVRVPLDAVGKAIQSVKRSIDEGIKSVLSDIVGPDSPVMKLPEYQRSVASMVNKVVSPLNNFSEKNAKCAAAISGSLGVKLPKIPNITPSIEQGQRILNSIDSGKIVSDYLLNSIKTSSNSQIEKASTNVKSATSYYIVGSELDDTLNSHVSKAASLLSEASTELGSIRGALAGKGAASASWETKIDSIRTNLGSLKASIEEDFPAMLDITRTNIGSVEDYTINRLKDLNEDIAESVDGIREMSDETFTSAYIAAQSLAFPKEESQIDVLLR